MLWVTGSAGTTDKKLNYVLGEFTDTAGSQFYQSTTEVTKVSGALDLPITQNDLSSAGTTRLYVGGYPAIGAAPNNPNYGGCGFFSNITFMPNYAPAATTDDLQLILNHMVDRSLNLGSNIFKYFFRIKNVDALDLVKQCDVPSVIQLKMKDTNNDYIQKGIQFGYGDFYECVNKNMMPTGDLVVSFRFYATQLPNADFNLLSLVYKTPSNFHTGTITNGKLPVWFHIIKLGFFLCADGKIKVYHLGLPYKLTQTFAINTGYTVTVVSKRYDDTFYTGALGINRLFLVYINGVYTQTFTLKGDFGVFLDAVAASGSQRNHYFYIGDFSSNSIDRYNYAFVTPNPLNSFVTTNTERGFSDTFVNMQDILIYENTTVTTEPNAVSANCKLGVSGSTDCLVCKSDYALDSKFACSLKSSLPSYVVFSNNQDLMIDCGEGLFYNNELQICQICPDNCLSCSSQTSCQINTQGCTVANCAQCSANKVTCLKCSPGYAYNSGTNVCTQCQLSSSPNPCYSCDISDVFTCLRCYDTFYYNTGSAICDSCDAVRSFN